MKPTHVFLAFAVRIAVALMVAAFAVSIVRAEPPTFTVTNRMAEFKVVNKCQPCTLCDGDCRCRACDCNVLEARLAKPPMVKPPVVAKKTTTQTVIFHGNSTTHTHACPNKDCPFRKAYGEPYVWGGKNHDHVCPYCQTEQTVTSNRPVTIVREVAVANAPPPTVRQFVPVQRAAYQPSPVMQTLYSSVSSGGGCASGQCSTTLQGRRGFFR